MEQELKLRRAVTSDLGTVVLLFQNATNVMNQNGISQWDELYPNEEILQEDISKGEMLLGEIDGRLVSVAVLNNQYDSDYENGAWKYPDSNFMVLHRLCVNPLYQNRGFGPKMVHAVEMRLRENGVTTVRLDAFSLNPYALRMYEKLGYAKVGDITFRKGLFYLFEKKL